MKRTFRIEASIRNPAEMTGYVRGNLKTYRIVGSRTQANQCAVNFWMKGYWVEVYDKETGELLAGPLNPDEALPSYIV